MAVDFYVAGRWRNRDAVAGVVDRIEAHGFSCNCFVRTDYAGLLDQLGGTGDVETMMRNAEARGLDDPVIRTIFETDLEAQRSAERFLLVLPAGIAGHLEAGIAYGSGKPCYAVGPVAKTETLYRIFDKILPTVEELDSWLGGPAIRD